MSDLPSQYAEEVETFRQILFFFIVFMSADLSVS